MNNPWVSHSIQTSKSTGVTLKEGLTSHDNAAHYFSKKADTTKESYKKELLQEMCSDQRSLNAVNRQNAKYSVEYMSNEIQLKKKREYIKKVLQKEAKPPKPPKEAKPPKTPKEAKPPKTPKEAKPPKTPKEAKPPKPPKEAKPPKPPKTPKEAKPPKPPKEAKPPKKAKTKKDINK